MHGPPGQAAGATPRAGREGRRDGWGQGSGSLRPATGACQLLVYARNLLPDPHLRETLIGGEITLIAQNDDEPGRAISDDEDDPIINHTRQ